MKHILMIGYSEGEMLLTRKVFETPGAAVRYLNRCEYPAVVSHRARKQDIRVNDFKKPDRPGFKQLSLSKIEQVLMVSMWDATDD